MRKFIFSRSAQCALRWLEHNQATRRGPRDWRLILMWASWGLTLAIAVGTVIKENEVTLATELED